MAGLCWRGLAPVGSNGSANCVVRYVTSSIRLTVSFLRAAATTKNVLVNGIMRVEKFNFKWLSSCRSVCHRVRFSRIARRFANLRGLMCFHTANCLEFFCGPPSGHLDTKSKSQYLNGIVRTKSAQSE